MTAQNLINSLRATSLVGIKIADVSEQNTATLLSLLNMAKAKIAEDTLLWLGGEQHTLVNEQYVYTLDSIPIQIIDVYDSNNILRPRNSVDYFGYYQTSPNTIKINNIDAGTVININYYETPLDYTIDAELVIPPTLLSAMQSYIAHKAFEIYKADNDMFSSVEYYKKYVAAVNDFMSKSDSSDVDTIIGNNNRIWKRGLI